MASALLIRVVFQLIMAWESAIGYLDSHLSNSNQTHGPGLVVELTNKIFLS
jgi:hypothetical protein